MADEIPFASRIGADSLVSLLHDNARFYLRKKLVQLPAVVNPDFSKLVTPEVYVDIREQLALSATIAAISGDAQLESIVGHWLSLQQGYARQVIKEVNEEIKTQKGMLDEYDKELLAGQKDRNRLTTLARKTVLEMEESELAEVVALKKKITKLDKTQKEREQLHRSINSVSAVDKTLSALIESGSEAIHYVIPKASEIWKRLGSNSYTGPDFIPFVITKTAMPNDIFPRSQTPPDIRKPNSTTHNTTNTNLNALPDILSELVKMYNYVVAQPASVRIIPSEVKDHLNIESLTVKGIAAYLDDNNEIFGVEKIEAAGSRTFTKKALSTVMVNQEFIKHMTQGRLKQADAQTVNSFYFQKALAMLREQPAAYEGFTKDTLSNISENEALLVSSMYISLNLRNSESRTAQGIQILKESDGDTVYRFTKIVPTDRHFQYLEDAVKEFGIARFSPADLMKKAHSAHGEVRIIPAVVETALQERYEQWGLRIAGNDPLTYQKEERSLPPVKPKSATKETLM